MSEQLIQNTAANVMVLMVSSTDHVAGVPSLTLAITASKDGGAFAAITPTVTDRGDGWYSLALTTTHTNTLGDLVLHITGTGADPSDIKFRVVVAPVAPVDPLGTDVSTGYAGSQAGALLNKLNFSGNAASSAEVLAISNNTSTRLSIPSFFERPAIGSTAFVLDLYIYDDAGNMETPDSTPTLAVINAAGADRSANLGSVTNIDTGHYRVTYTVASTHLTEQLRFEWTIVEGGLTRLAGQSVLVDDAAPAAPTVPEIVAGLFSATFDAALHTRDQSGVTDPTVADALYGSWVVAFGADDAAVRTFNRRGATDQIVRAFALAANVNSQSRT